MLSDFLKLVFPACCIGCDHVLVQQEKHLCLECLQNLPEGFSDDSENKDLLHRFPSDRQPKFVFTFLEYKKKGLVHNIINAIKYENGKDLAYFLGMKYAEALMNKGFQNDFDLIIPVPLHAKRIQQRGYNQSDFFAKGFSEKAGLRYDNTILQREKFSSSQTNKSRIQRWLNVKESYRVPRKEQVKDLHVLLADDVLTTGATLVACTDALMEAGIKNFSVVVIAVAK